MFSAIQNIDFQILDLIQKYVSCPFLDTFFPLYTTLGDPVFFILYCALLIAIPKTRKDGIVVSCGLLSGFLFANVLIKNFVLRSRPCWLRPDFPLLIQTPTDYSFPSGHTMAATVFTVILIYRHPKLAFGLVPAALLLMFSRLYLYVHFPSDILGGLIFGTAVGILTCLLEAEISRKWEERKITRRKM